MQDIHPIGGLGGDGGGSRLFGGGVGGGGDRRLRQHHHPSQALKCPRCDSLNTKFCYYNNYNLSQPRHFCKSCRRYWTKGGVLRNVPVGGGCRKSKRSKPKPPPPSEADAAAAPDDDNAAADSSPRRKKASSNSSSSDSSSLTAATTRKLAAAAAAPPPQPPPPPPSDPCSSSSSTFLGAAGFPESRFFLSQSAPNGPSPNPNPRFEIDHSTSDAAAILPEIGNFSSLMTDPAILSYNVSSEASPAPPYRLHPQSEEPPSVRDDSQSWELGRTTTGMPSHHQDQEQLKLQELLDQTVQVDQLPGAQSRSSINGLFPPLDWQTGGEQGLFDLTGAVDHGYWGVQNQWSDDHHDHHIYLP